MSLFVLQDISLGILDNSMWTRCSSLNFLIYISFLCGPNN